METEIWVDILNYPGYQTSSYGRVRSLGNSFSRKEKILSQAIATNGYSFVGLQKNKKMKLIMVHRLVAHCFHGLILEGEGYDRRVVVLHLDDDKQNNHKDNLKIGTQKENLKDMLNKGRGNFCSRIILQYSLDGIFIKEFNSITCAASSLGIKRESIWSCLNGRSKTSGGFAWKYK